ncbi:MAG: polysaccharide deacetylase family protein, partial [Saccharofermentanales bacterium]
MNSKKWICIGAAFSVFFATIILLCYVFRKTVNLPLLDQFIYNSENKNTSDKLISSESSLMDISEYSFISEKYCVDDFTIQYPQICNFHDQEKQLKINEIIYSDIVKLFEYYTTEIADASLKIDYKITLKSSQIFSIQYFGVYSVRTAA